MKRLLNWVETLLTNMTDRRRKKVAKKLVKGLLSTTQELRDTSKELDLGECAFTLASPEPPYDIDAHVGHRIAAKRAELGYKDDDGLVFTVPITYSCSSSGATRSIDLKHAGFKKFK